MGSVASVGHVLGVDIGGAHLKLANSAGDSFAVSFPMWRAADELASVLREAVEHFALETHTDFSQLAITMTGEMADCFANRSAGVEFILQQVASALPALPRYVYAVDGSWLSPESACRQAWDVAASNWHALAQWIARTIVLPGDNLRLVLDVGSTTVDVIPVTAGRIATSARCDSERLRKRQLVYTGVGRTAVAAILSSASIDGMDWPLVAERFATSDDAYVALGLVPAADASDDCEELSAKISRYGTESDTADGRPRTVAAARVRLARMLGEDCERLEGGQVDSLARQVVARQARQVAQAIAENLATHAATHEPALILISGHGYPLAEAAIALLPQAVDCVYLAERITPSAARCAPAVAVAWLLDDHLRHVKV
jgi:(4-(4-[2-(gamma-L-glutamylamino)ethyl]phenoxymethyl)furan-2-yl)methanamine synthase